MNDYAISDDYKSGWNKGLKDAGLGLEPDYASMAHDWKLAFEFISFSLDTYIEGYKAGYEHGMHNRPRPPYEVKETTDNQPDNLHLSNPNLTNNPMSKTSQNYELELQALEEMNTFLVQEICEHGVSLIFGQMKGFVMHLEDTGVALQVCKRYNDEMFKADGMLFQKLYNSIIENDLRWIEQYCEMINNELNRANGGYIQVRLIKPQTVRPTVTRDVVVRSDALADMKLQAQATAQYMNFLVDERDHLLHVLKNYGDRLQQMQQNGVPKQIIEHYYKNFVPNNVSNIKKLALHIQDIDYPYLDKVLKQTVQDIKRLDSNFDIQVKRM